MVALFPNQDTFVRGEISPRLHARASLDLYRAGLSECENFITLAHGGIRKRGATYFAGEVKDSSKKARLIEFVFSAEQAYALELGNLYLRVYAYGARVGTVELSTPWPEQILDELLVYQSADVMWLVHPDHPAQVLTRVSHTSWTLAPYDFKTGPFGAANTDEGRTLQLSAAVGTATLTANTALFHAGMVGQLVRIDMVDYSNIKPWEAGQIIKPGLGSPTNVIGILRRYDGNVYRCSFSSTTELEIRTGSTPPTHTRGEEWDGTNEIDTTGEVSVVYGAKWEFMHSGYGVGVITEVASATSATVVIYSRFPDEVVSGPSWDWRLGAFESDNNADAVAIFEERLTFAQRFSVFASKTGDFNNFQLGEKDDDALEFLQAGGGQANDIVWIADADGAMVIGTTGGIRSLSGSGIDEALTPSSFKNRKSRAYGCAKIQPVDAGSSFIYVTRSRKVLAELTRDSTGRFAAEDITQVSEHVTKKGIVSLAYQNDPDPILWFPLANGEMGGLTHQPAQEVRGVHRHRLGGEAAGSDWGIVESAVVTPGLSGSDDVWLIVRRTIGGITKRYIEIMQEPFEYRAIETAFQVDCGLSRNGAPSNTATGLSHLEGETVHVLADGRVYKGLTVSGGSVSLPGGATAQQWHVGLPQPAQAATLELDVGARDGSMIGRRKKIGKVILSLLETDTTGLKIQSLIRGKWEQVKLKTIVPPDGKACLFTGNVEVPIDDSWEGQGRIRILHDNPTPCTIRAMTPVFEGEP